MIQLREQFWAVEVPEDGSSYNILSSFQPNTLSYEYSIEKAERCETGLIAMVDLPAGTWQIVCTSKEVTEEQAMQIVEQQKGGGMFKDYQMRGSIAQYGTYMIQLAVESLHSLLISKECDLNKTYLILKKQ